MKNENNDLWITFTNEPEKLIEEWLGFMNNIYIKEEEASTPTVIEGGERNTCSQKPA